MSVCIFAPNERCVQLELVVFSFQGNVVLLFKNEPYFRIFLWPLFSFRLNSILSKKDAVLKRAPAVMAVGIELELSSMFGTSKL